MARYGGLVQVQASQITSTVSSFRWVLTEGCFLSTAIDGGSQSILNGGGNLRVYTDATKTTQIPIEVVTFVTGGSPSVQVWLLSTSLNSGSTVYVEADTVAISQPPVTDTYGRNAVWPNTSGSYRLEDRITNSNGGTSLTTTGTVTDGIGIIGGAQSFGGNGSYLDTSISTQINNGYISLWIKPASTSVTEFIISDRSSISNYIHIAQVNATINLRIEQFAQFNISSGNVLSVGVWTHLFAMWGSNGMELFVNGTSVGVNAYTGAWTPTSNILIGSAEALPSLDFKGDIDEVVVGNSLVNITDDYITAEYNNQNNPTAFAQMISWEDQDAGSGIVLTPSETSITAGSFNPTVSLTTVINLLPSDIEHTSESLDPLVILSTEVVLSVTQTEHTVGSLAPIVDLVATVNVVSQEIVHQVSSLDPTILLNSGVVVSPSTTEQQQESVDPLVVLTSEVFISPVVSETTSASENPALVLGTPVTVQPTTTQVNLESLDSSITLNAEVFVQPVTTEVQAISLDPVVILSVPISIAPTTGQQEQNSQNPTVDLLNVVSVSPQTTDSTQESLDPQVELQFGLSIISNTTEITIESLSPNISFGVNVEIESFTIKYTSDQVSVSYTDNQVQIKYSS